MSEEQKYYTPSMEELHVGMEVEIRLRIREGFWSYVQNKFKYVDWWKTKTIRKRPESFSEAMDELSDQHNVPFSIDDYIQYLKDDAIRIKYLDKEDIESLGWVKRGLPEDTNPIMSFQKDKWHLHIVPMLGGLPYRVYTIDDEGKPEMFFRGKLKNKSELQRLMEQIGIV